MKYQAFYCEENVWKALEDDVLSMPKQWAVFVSNPERTCALWSQRAAHEVGQPVIWDYHVVVMGADIHGHVWVLDQDHIRGHIRTLEGWLHDSFPLVGRIPPSFDPMFRVVERSLFFDAFRTDRSHMLDEHDQWMQPPPAWPLLSTTSNLMAFVDMEAPDIAGEVHTLVTLREWASENL